MKKIMNFIKKEPVFCAACLLMLASAFFVTPNKEYFGYIDYKVLALLFCLMAVVAGFKSLGAFRWLTWQLLRRIQSGGLFQKHRDSRFQTIPGDGNVRIYGSADHHAVQICTLKHLPVVLFALALPAALCGIAGNWIGASLTVKKGVGFIRWMLLVVLVLLLAKMVVDVL